MYKYFISYSHVRNNHYEYVCCELELKCKITSFEAIKEITKDIEEYHNKQQVVISNFILFDE